jgi:hypothetical protein
MTTPGGTISAWDVWNEFGLGVPVHFSDFWGKGGAPAGSTISLGDMRNRSNVVFSPDGGSLADYGWITLSCSVPALWSYTGGTGGTASLGPGSMGNSISFTANDVKAGIGRAVTWNVTGMAGIITRTFSITAYSPSY